MADDLTPAELSVLTKTLSPEQLQSVWGKFTEGERAELKKMSPTYIPPAPATSEGALGELKQYGKELLTGEGAARGDVADYLKREVKGAEALPGQMYRAIRHPIVTAQGIQAAADKFKSQPLTESAVDFVSSPETVGATLAAEALPEVAGAGKTGLNKAGTALATSEKLQKVGDTLAGTVLGVAGAKSLGISPFIGGFMGRNLIKDSGVPARIGETIEKYTGGRAGAPEEVVAPSGGPTLAEFSKAPQLKGMSPEEIKNLYEKTLVQKASTPAPSAMRIPAPMPSHPPVEGPPVVPMASHEPAPMAPEAKAANVTNQILDRQAMHQPSPTAGVQTRNPMGAPQPPPAPPAPPQVPPNGVLPENLQDTSTSHGPDSSYWQGQKQDMRFAGGDAQYAASRAKGRAMRAAAEKKAAEAAMPTHESILEEELAKGVPRPEPPTPPKLSKRQLFEEIIKKDPTALDRAHLLRTDPAETLATEVLQKRMGPGARVMSLKGDYPMIPGKGAAQAMRQRGNILSDMTEEQLQKILDDLNAKTK